VSHFTKVKTKIHDLASLKKALDGLHYQYEEGHMQVKDFYKQITDVNLAVRTGTGDDIGFRLEGDVYEMIADWWAVERSAKIKQQVFIDQVTQQYAYNKTVTELESRGFYIANEEKTQENVIQLTVRWY
jgi:hypothetical protein